jgi:hypothetical protein
MYVQLICLLLGTFSYFKLQIRYVIIEQEFECLYRNKFSLNNKCYLIFIEKKHYCKRKLISITGTSPYGYNVDKMTYKFVLICYLKKQNANWSENIIFTNGGNNSNHLNWFSGWQKPSWHIFRFQLQSKSFLENVCPINLLVTWYISGILFSIHYYYPDVSIEILCLSLTSVI